MKLWAPEAETRPSEQHIASRRATGWQRIKAGCLFGAYDFSFIAMPRFLVNLTNDVIIAKGTDERVVSRAARTGDACG